MNYSTFICAFESGNCGRVRGTIQKREYIKNENSFLDEIKKIFHRF